MAVAELRSSLLERIPASRYYADTNSAKPAAAADDEI
jgi:hypothetical protein